MKKLMLVGILGVAIWFASDRFEAEIAQALKISQAMQGEYLTLSVDVSREGLHKYSTSAEPTPFPVRPIPKKSESGVRSSRSKPMKMTIPESDNENDNASDSLEAQSEESLEAPSTNENVKVKTQVSGRLGTSKWVAQNEAAMRQQLYRPKQVDCFHCAGKKSKDVSVFGIVLHVADKKVLSPKGQFKRGHSRRGTPVLYVE